MKKHFQTHLMQSHLADFQTPLSLITWSILSMFGGEKIYEIRVEEWKMMYNLYHIVCITTLKILYIITSFVSPQTFIHIYKYIYIQGDTYKVIWAHTFISNISIHVYLHTSIYISCIISWSHKYIKGKKTCQTIIPVNWNGELSLYYFETQGLCSDMVWWYLWILGKGLKRE